MRQKIRRLTLLISFLLFPITIWYFSPYLIIQGFSEHVMNGSFFVFVLMFLLSMFFGRAWCGYLCPTGGLQECVQRINVKPAKQGKRDRIKFVIWILWMTAVVVTFILGKNKVTVNPFYMTKHGISISEINHYVVYYGVVFFVVAPALIHGKRAFCHYVCWMAPFMIIGSTVGRWLHLPQFHIEIETDQCVGCGKCSTACPMGLDVRKLVSEDKDGALKTTECIQCGACVDDCPKKVLSYRMRFTKRG